MNNKIKWQSTPRSKTSVFKELYLRISNKISRQIGGIQSSLDIEYLWEPFSILLHRKLHNNVQERFFKLNRIVGKRR